MKPPPWYILLPEGRLKTFWNLVVVALLMYTATVVPYRTSFVDVNTLGWTIFESFLDFLFFIDIFVNFFSAIESKDGKFVTSLR